MLNLKSRLLFDGYNRGYVKCELVARELKISYNAGENCFFPVSKEVLDEKLDNYFEGHISSSGTSNPILFLVQIAPINNIEVGFSAGFNGNGRA